MTNENENPDSNEDDLFIPNEGEATEAPELSDYIRRITTTFTAYSPIRISLTEDSEEEQPDVNILITTDPTMKSDGFASYDPDESTFAITIPPHVQVVGVNVQQVLNHYSSNGKTIFANIHDYPDIFSISIDDSAKPACVWYSPSQAEIDRGATQLPNYPFNRARRAPSCSNPAVSGAKGTYVNCNYSTCFSACRFSTLDQWETLSTAYADDTAMISMQRKFFGNRVAYYQLYDHTTDSTIIDKTTQVDVVSAGFNERAENLTIQNHEPEKRSYFKAVLA